MQALDTAYVLAADETEPVPFAPRRYRAPQGTASTGTTSTAGEDDAAGASTATPTPASNADADADAPAAVAAAPETAAAGGAAATISVPTAWALLDVTAVSVLAFPVAVTSRVDTDPAIEVGTPFKEKAAGATPGALTRQRWCARRWTAGQVTAVVVDGLLRHLWHRWRALSSHATDRDRYTVTAILRVLRYGAHRARRGGIPAASLLTPPPPYRGHWAMQHPREQGQFDGRMAR